MLEINTADIVEKELVTKISITDLPQSILESDILPYLNSKDLFYSVRGVSSDWQEFMKNIWTDNIKSEMIDQVKSLDFIYEKEIYTKTYEFKLNYLINYKQLLSVYNSQTNILAYLKMYANKLNESDFRKFYKIFFAFIGMQSAHSSIENLENESDDEIKAFIIANLEGYLSQDQILLIFRNKVFELLDLENNSKDPETISLFSSRLAEINREQFENSEENTKLLFTVLQGLIEFQSLKAEVKELRKKIENLIKRIKEETQIWPKRKNFFEKAYKLIIFSKSTNDGVKKMIRLFESEKIRHPLIDFNDQALQMIFELKNNFTRIFGTQDICKEHFEELGGNKIEEIIFNNILARRVLLTQKILIMDKFSQIYNETKTNKKNIFKLKEGVEINLKQFLWCLKFSSNSQSENLSIDSLLKTKEYLDEHFDYENNIIYDCGKKKQRTEKEEKEFIDPELEDDLSELDRDLEVTFKNSDLSLSTEDKSKINIHKNQSKRHTEESLNRLRIEKEILEEQKSKTENILQMLKKFVSLKQNLTNNKKKYKLALYLLSNIRQGDSSILNRIDELDVDSIVFNDEMQISETEKEELDNFKDSDVLMKEIEEGILIQIENILQKEKNKDIVNERNKGNEEK
jgi:hypothetical protein